MPIEINSYEIQCSGCGEVVEFKINDVDDLPGDIEEEVDDACRSERADVEREYSGFIDPDDHNIHGRTIHDLAAAIMCGDKETAMRLLEGIADELGKRNDFEIGQFSPEAKGAV